MIHQARPKGATPRGGLRAVGWIVAVLLLLAWWAIPDGPAGAAAPDLPRCQEDAVLVGIGSFDDGRWTEYTCGPAVDDYEEG